MIIPINAGKPFDNLIPSHDKNIQQTNNKGALPQLLKIIYIKFTAKITLNSERLLYFSG